MSRRFAFALAVGVIVGALVWVGHAPPSTRVDFDAVGHGAQAMLRGQNPYTAVRALVDAGQLGWPLYYPATAPTFVLPLAWASYRVILTVWTALGMAALAYTLTGYRRWLLISAPAVHAVLLGQWSPWLVAGIGLPWLGVWAAKPTIGLALFAGWPSRKAAISGTVLVLVSLVLVPSWPADWLATVRGQPQYLPPILRPFGFLLLLGFLRWRTPEGRMLGVLALVPHTTVLHEMLYPLLVARTGKQLAVLQGLGYLAAYLVYTRTAYGPASPPTMLQQQWPYVLVLAYIPALVVLLMPQSVGSFRTRTGICPARRSPRRSWCR